MEEEMLEIEKDKTGYYYFNLLSNLEKDRFVKNYMECRLNDDITKYLEVTYPNQRNFICNAFQFEYARYPFFPAFIKPEMKVRLREKYWLSIACREKLPKYRFDNDILLEISI